MFINRGNHGIENIIAKIEGGGGSALAAAHHRAGIG